MTPCMVENFEIKEFGKNNESGWLCNPVHKTIPPQIAEAPRDMMECRGNCFTENFDWK